MDAYIIDGIRTPIGSYQGTLSAVRTDDLATLVIKTLVGNNPNIPKEAYDDVIMGCTNQAGEDNRNVARMSALLAVCLQLFPEKLLTDYVHQDYQLSFMQNQAIKTGDGQCIYSRRSGKYDPWPFM